MARYARLYKNRRIAGIRMETVFSLDLPQRYMMRITGQLEIELRESLEVAVVDD
jgi:hypothetical protein